MGTVRNESNRWFDYGDQPFYSKKYYETLITQQFPMISDQILALYPATKTLSISPLNPNRLQMTALTTDYLFICPIRQALRGMILSAPGWAYTFFHEPSYDPVNGETGNCLDAVCHSAELPYVFDLQGRPYFTTPGEPNLAASLGYYWFTLLSYGKSLITPPPATGQYLPTSIWLPYNSLADQYLAFDLPSTQLIQDYRSTYCNFWDQFGYGK